MFSVFSFSQKKKKIFLLDKDGNPINRFDVYFYRNSDVKLYKNSESKNIFYLNKKFDSIIIDYNFFYRTKIQNRNFKKVDTLFLTEEVSLKEVHLNNKIRTIGTHGKIYNFGTSVYSEGINRFDVSKYVGNSLKYVSFYVLNEYKNKFVSKKKLKSSNKKFELYLFQSNNKNPNLDSEIVNLLKKPLIVEIGKIYKKDWIKISLRSFDINIENYKYLFVGYKNMNNYIGMGHSKRKKNKNIESFYRVTSTFDWQHIDWYPKGGIYIPAIRIGLIDYIY